MSINTFFYCDVGGTFLRHKVFLFLDMIEQNFQDFEVKKRGIDFYCTLHFLAKIVLTVCGKSRL